MNAASSTLPETAARSRCLAEYQRLVSIGNTETEIRSALEALADVLANLMPSAVGDPEIALRIGNIRTLVDTHLLATFQLTDAGADPTRTADLLRRVYRQACRDLGTLVGQPAIA